MSRSDILPKNSTLMVSSQAVQLGKYPIPVGDWEPLPTSKHHICMHIGAPISTRRSLDGRTQDRVQFAGDFDIVPARMAGRWRNEQAFELLVVEIEPSIAARFGDDLAVDDVMLPGLQLRDPHLYHLTLALKADVEEPSLAGQLYRESLMTALLTRLFILQRRFEPAANQTTSLFTPLQQRKLVEFIEENLANDLSIPSLAAYVGYGLSRFKTLFKNSFGATPHAYVLQRRVERAKCLIEAGTLTLSQVALEAGFAHQSHMSKAFHQSFNISPSDLRRMRHVKTPPIR